ncbi:MAG TPA: hypothetical protein VGI71_05465 [Scandinavium sp.]|jgi:hypothetical protein
MKSVIEEYIKNVDNVTDVVITSQEIGEDNKSLMTKLVFKFGEVKIQSSIFENTAISILGFIMNFHYTIQQKITRQALLEMVNDFNKKAPGAKASLKNIEGKKIIIDFRIETFFSESSDMKNIIAATLPMFILSPVMLSKTLENKGYKHNSIMED